MCDREASGAGTVPHACGAPRWQSMPSAACSFDTAETSMLTCLHLVASTWLRAASEPCVCEYSHYDYQNEYQNDPEDRDRAASGVTLGSGPSGPRPRRIAQPLHHA